MKSAPELTGKILTPARIELAGPTMCGKSTFMKYLVQYRDIVFDKPFMRIIYVAPDNGTESHFKFIQELEKACDFIEIIRGNLPSLESLQGNDDHTLLLVDDFSMSLLSSKSYLEIF